MSNEEKAIKGIEWSQQQMRLGNLSDYDQGHYADISIVLDLIKKQQKEIEELKDTRSVFNMGRRSYKNEIEDKIKAKIEEYEKELNKLLQKEEWLEPHDTIKRNKYMHYIEFGQSLLEKELSTTITKEELEKIWKE